MPIPGMPFTWLKCFWLLWRFVWQFQAWGNVNVKFIIKIIITVHTWEEGIIGLSQMVSIPSQYGAFGCLDVEGSWA